MKHLLIIFSLLLTSVSWSKDVDFKDLVKRDGLWYEKFTNEPFTGNSTGLKQGKETTQHLEQIISRLAFMGGVFLAFLAFFGFFLYLFGIFWHLLNIFDYSFRKFSIRSFFFNKFF
mgnify:CR=1 FL=1